MEQRDICSSCMSPDACVARFRNVAAAAGLVVVSDGSLASFAGSVHLHLRLQGERTGVLEYTMAPSTGQAWLSVHANRSKPWIGPVIERLGNCGCVPGSSPNSP